MSDLVLFGMGVFLAPVVIGLMLICAVLWHYFFPPKDVDENV